MKSITFEEFKDNLYVTKTANYVQYSKYILTIEQTKEPQNTKQVSVSIVQSFEEAYDRVSKLPSIDNFLFLLPYDHALQLNFLQYIYNKVIPTELKG